MKNRAYRTNIFAHHTRNIARRIHCNGIKIADKIHRLRANCYTRATMNTGIPANVKDNRFVFTHYLFE